MTETDATPDGGTGIDAQVIVVGAGPIGLTTGCALRHHGVECLILEERTETRPASRANNLWARPQELLVSWTKTSLPSLWALGAGG